MVLNETPVPAVAVRRARDWWFPLRVSAFLAVAAPLLPLAALLSAAMHELDEETKR